MTLLAAALDAQRRSVIALRARELVDAANAWGLVLTVTLEPKAPLAMGRHEVVIDLRPTHGDA